MKFYWNTTSLIPFPTAVAELTETIWPTKPKTFTVWPFTEKKNDNMYSMVQVCACVQKKTGKKCTKIVIFFSFVFLPFISLYCFSIMDAHNFYDKNYFLNKVNDETIKIHK